MSDLFWSIELQNKIRPRMLRRAVFSDQQRKGLEMTFSKQKYIAKTERKKLAQRLALKDSQVNIRSLKRIRHLVFFYSTSFRWRSGKRLSKTCLANFYRFHRFQNRRMKWRNTKELQVFTSTNSMTNVPTDSWDSPEKEEIMPCSPSTIDNKTNRTDENCHSRKD